MAENHEQKNQGGRWVRNAALARYMGVSVMTIWRWARDPALEFPRPSVVRGISYTDLDEIDAWMRKRVVDLAVRQRKKTTSAAVTA